MSSETSHPAPIGVLFMAYGGPNSLGRFAGLSGRYSQWPPDHKGRAGRNDP